MKKHAGFTLVEMMIVVGLVGILSAIAIPSYTAYVQRGKIAEAASQLSTMAVKLEQYFQDNRTYVGACAVNTVAALPTNTQYFTYTCPVLTATTFSVQAVGVASVGMTGFTYTIGPNNAKATTSVPAGWTTNATCWVTRTGGIC